ncbi:MAG: T9SS type A sorting domain-containing protein, partial [Bacteroidota bacterium]
VAAQPAPQWTPLPGSPTHGYRFEDAAFVSPEAGWIVNGSGEVWSTEDGGLSWAFRSDSEGYLRSAAFPSADLGWVGVLFSDTRLYETRDGGTTMTDVTDRIQPAIGGGVCGLWALDETHAFGVGEWDGPAYFIKTTDGGATWQSTDMSAYASSLIDVYFTDPMNGIVVGGTNATQAGSRAVVLTTTDGGATWTERYRSSGTGTTAEWAWKISFPTPEVGYVSVEFSSGGFDGKVLKTTDGGTTWQELSVPGGNSMQGVGFLSADVGWTSGRGTDKVTTNGGLTWESVFDLDGSVNRFEFFGDTLGFAMGQEVYRLAFPVAAEPEPGPLALSVQATPNPASGAVTWRIRNTRAGRLTVVDALGRTVATLPVAPGSESLTWDARGLAPGVYHARLVSDGRAATARVVLR